MIYDLNIVIPKIYQKSPAKEIHHVSQWRALFNFFSCLSYLYNSKSYAYIVFDSFNFRYYLIFHNEKLALDYYLPLFIYLEL